MDDLLQIARDRKRRIEEKSNEVDDFIISIERFLTGCRDNREFLEKEFEYLDEFILYGGYIQRTAARRLEILLEESKRIDNFVSFAEFLLNGDPDDDLLSGKGAQRVGGRAARAESEGHTDVPWLNDVARHATEQGARSAGEGLLRHATRPGTT